MAGFTLPSDADQDPGTAAPSAGFVLPSDVDTSPSTGSDVVKGFGAGLAQGEAGLAALPRTIHDAAKSAADWAVGQTAGRLSNYINTGSADAIPASQVAARSAAVDKLSGGVPDLAPSYDQTKAAVESVTGPLYQAQTLPGQVAQKVGEYIPASVMGPGSVPSQLAMAAGSGAGDELAGAATKGSAYEPYARFAGALVGGGAGSLATGAVEKALPAVSNSAAEKQATNIVMNAAEDPAALKAAAATDTAGNLPSNTQLPGWNQTTAQRFQDPGLLDLEKAVQTRNPTPFVQNEYGTGTAQQNAAGESFVNSLKGAGDPTDVPAMFMAQKQRIEDAHDAFLNQQSAAQQQALGSIGGDRSVTAYGRDISDQLAPQYNAIQGQAKSAVSALGGTGQPAAYGPTMRDAAQSSYNTNNDALGKLFDVVPDHVTTPIAPVKQMAVDLYKGMDPALEATVTPMEEKISNAISRYPNNIPFGQARNIDTLITSSMRQELRTNGRTPAYARMVQMKGAWEDALSNAVENQNGVEQQAVASGAMAPKDTMGAALQQQADEFVAQRRAAGTGLKTGTGGNGPSGPTAFSGSSGAEVQSGRQLPNAQGDQGVQGAGATAGPPISQADLDALNAAKQGTKDFANTFKKGPVGDILKSDGTSGSYKVPDGTVPAKVFPSGPNGTMAVNAYKKAVGDDATASDALHNYAASTLRKTALNDDGTLNPAGYAKWRNTYGPAFDALPDAVKKNFDTAAHAADGLQKFGKFNPSIAPYDVPEMFFSPGPAGGQGVQHLRSMIGPDKADPLLSDYAASQLKAKAVNPDGSINSAALGKFAKAHDEALSQLPALKSQISTLQGTSDLIGKAAASRANTLKEFQKGAAKKFLNLDDGTEVRDAVGRMIDANNVSGLKKLMQATAVDPAAQAGVKRAAADHLANKFLSESSTAGTTGTKDLMRGTIGNMLNDKRAALSQVLSKDQMQGLQMLKNNIANSNLSRDAMKIKGSPNTAADYIRAMKFEPEKRGSILHKLAESAIAGEELGGEHGAILASALAVGSHLKNALRDAGMRKTYDVVERMVLDPEFAKTMIAKAPIRPGVGSEVTAAHKLGSYSMFRTGAQAPIQADSQRTSP